MYDSNVNTISFHSFIVWFYVWAHNASALVTVECAIELAGFGVALTIMTLPTIYLFTILDRLEIPVPPRTHMKPHLTLSTTHYQYSPICQKAWKVKAVARKNVVGCDLQHTGEGVETTISMGISDTPRTCWYHCGVFCTLSWVFPDFWYPWNLLILLQGSLYPLPSLPFYLINLIKLNILGQSLANFSYPGRLNLYNIALQ